MHWLEDNKKTTLFIILISQKDMLTQQDLQQIAAKGIAEEQLQKQMDDFKRGFPFLRLDSAVTVGHGILAPTEAEREEYIRQWDAYKAGKHRVTK